MDFTIAKGKRRRSFPVSRSRGKTQGEKDGTGHFKGSGVGDVLAHGKRKKGPQRGGELGDT